MATGLTELGTRDFDDERLQRPGVWLVDFGANWCPPCRVLERVLAPLAAENAGRLSVGSVNIDDHEDVAARFRITSAPTMLLFRDGQLLDRRVGAAPRAAIDKWLASAL